MAAHRPAHPNFFLGTVRRHGGYDYERFDNITSSSVCAGYGLIGKVNVNCSFLFAKSKWGVLGENKNPAGIIYLDLDFGLPPDCRLKSATVLVTLEEVRDKVPSYRAEKPPWPIGFTDYYGPKRSSGERKEAQVKQTFYLNPNVNAFGFGGGGIGVEKETNKVLADRWKFSGQLIQGEGRNWAYKTLKWELTENKLDPQSLPGPIHTAFAFQHNGKQFHMKVDVKGKLKKWNDRLETKLRFGSNQRSMVTLIRFPDRYSLERPLDDLARGLRAAMEAENLNEVPVEVADALPTTFEQTLLLRQSETLSSQQSIAAAPVARPSNEALVSHLLNQPRPLESVEMSTSQDPNHCSLEDLARAVRLVLPSSLPTSSQGHRHQASMLVSSPSQLKEAGTGLNQFTARKAKTARSDVDMLLLLAELPYFLAFMRLIASIVGFRDETKLNEGAAGSSKTEAKREEEIGVRPRSPADRRGGSV